MVSAQNSHQKVPRKVEKGYNCSLRVKQLLEIRGSPKPTFPILGNPASSLPSQYRWSFKLVGEGLLFLHVSALDSSVLTPGAL